MREAYRLYVAEVLKRPQKAPKGPRQGGPSGAFKGWVEEHHWPLRARLYAAEVLRSPQKSPGRGGPFGDLHRLGGDLPAPRSPQTPHRATAKAARGR
jgi:hypothetical protein